MYEEMEREMSTSFFDMVCDRAKIVGLVVASGTLFSALIIKANNILFAGVKGATRIPYSVSFIIFLLLLALGTAVLVKYSMDAYPFYNRENDEDKDEDEDIAPTIVPTQETMMFESVPSNSTPVATTAIDTGVEVAGADFAVNNFATNGLFTPLGTINNVVSSNNGVVINPVVTELEQQMIYNNSQEPIVEDTVFSEDGCCDVLWSDIDGDGTNDFIM